MATSSNIHLRAPVRSTLRIPPQHLDSERALLGSIMIRPDALHEIMESVTFDSFYAEKHKVIYQVMLELFSKGNPIDLLSMSSRLTDRGQLENVGGSSYLTELVNAVPSSANILHYAEIVSTKHKLRDLLEASEYIAGLGYAEAEALEEILDKAEKRIFEVTNFTGAHKFIEIKDTLSEAWDRIDHLHKTKDELRGVPTGFKDIDNKLAGLQKSDLIILAARPSVGKTSLALDIARKAAVEHNFAVGIFSLEMSAQQLIDRMLAAEANVDAWKLRTGKLTLESDFDKIKESLERLSRAPIYIDDQPGNNIIKMRAVARRLKTEKKLDLIIVDYLQLMVPTTMGKNDNLVQQVTEISRSLKNLARELNVPVLALSQLSRAVEQRGGKPRLSDLRDSGSIEQDADVVMFIHREDRYKESSDRNNIAEILIEKHRNGPTGHCELYFDDKKSTFMNIDHSSYNDDSNGGSSIDSF